MVNRNAPHEQAMKNLGVGPKFPGKGSTASGKDKDEKKRGL